MKRVIWIAVFCGLIFPVPAQEFTVKVPSGQTLTFVPTGMNTAALVPNEDVSITDKITGDVVVPEKVQHNGRTYTVTEIRPMQRLHKTFLEEVDEWGDPIVDEWGDPLGKDTVLASFDGPLPKNYTIKSLTIPATVKYIGKNCMDWYPSRGPDDEGDGVNRTLTVLAPVPPAVDDTCWVLTDKRLTYDKSRDEYYIRVNEADTVYYDWEEMGWDQPLRGTKLALVRMACSEDGVVVRVPKGSVDAYRNDIFWSRFVKIEEIQ